MSNGTAPDAGRAVPEGRDGRTDPAEWSAHRALAGVPRADHAAPPVRRRRHHGHIRRVRSLPRSRDVRDRLHGHDRRRRPDRVARRHVPGPHDLGRDLALPAHRPTGVFTPLERARRRRRRRALHARQRRRGPSAGADARGAPDDPRSRRRPQALPLAIFAVVLAGTLGITYWASKRTSTATEFWAAGRSVSGLQNGWAIAGDYMSASSFLGFAGPRVPVRCRRVREPHGGARRVRAGDAAARGADAELGQVHARRRAGVPPARAACPHGRRARDARRRARLPRRADGRRRRAHPGAHRRLVRARPSSSSARSCSPT